MLKSTQDRRESGVLLYILHSGNLYGTERMALATMEGLTEYAERIVYAPAPQGRGGGSVADSARRKGFRTKTVSGRWELVRALAALFTRFRHVDVIGNGVAQGFICHALAKLFRVRLRQLHVVHGGTEQHHAYGTRFHLNRLPIRVVAVSDYVRSQLISHRVQAGSIDVVDNFMSSSQLAEASHRASYLSSPPGGADGRAPLRVAIVSRVDPIKRVDVLVEAIERAGLEDFEFDVYGTGNALDEMRERAAKLPNVRFHGFVDDVAVRLAKADLLLHCCPDEPFGLAILESFTTGVVSIVPAAGGAGGLVDDGVNGLRFAPNDPDDLARMLRRAAASTPAELQAMADEAQRRMATRFSQNHGVGGYRAAFARLGH